MPNFESQRQRLEGHGDPDKSLGLISDHYTDLDSGEVWAKRKTGWTNRATITLHPTIRQKGTWLSSVRQASQGQPLESWICKTLDAAANPIPTGGKFSDYPEPKMKPVADLKAGDWFTDNGRSWKVVAMGDPYAKLQDTYGQPGSVHIGRLVTVQPIDPTLEAGTDVPAEG